VKTDPDCGSRVCILGAGLAGLSAAFDLARRGYRVTVLEAASRVGGLAESLLVDGVPLERFYHFICRSDTDLVKLVSELGLESRLHWRRSRTAFWYQGELYGFGSPLDLLRFRPVPAVERLRFGLNIMRSRYRRSWRELDRLSAATWLREQIGDRAYEVIWDPLLRIKFGDAHETVSAAWIWHRIHRIATSRRTPWGREHLGYLEHGSATLIDALVRRLAAMDNVTLRTGATVETVLADAGGVQGVRVDGDKELLPAGHVVSTVALALLPGIAPDLDPDYRRRLEGIEYLGVVCSMLVLRRSLSDAFWTNVNDRRVPFNGVIEYTNLNPVPGLGGRTVLYIPHYLRTSHPRFGFTDEALLAEAVAGLRVLRPDFEESWIDRFQVSRARHAQAICTVGFADQVPEHATPVPGLWITDSAQFYPEDRTVSAAIRLGRRVARLIAEEKP